MKQRIITVLLSVLIALQISEPILHMAIYGYEDLTEILSDVYDKGIIVVLCIAVLHLYSLIRSNQDK